MMEWKREKLGAYCNIISGYAFKSQDLKSEGDIPIIKIGTISNGGDLIKDDSMQFVSSEFLKLNTKFHVFYGDVLISLTGSHINNPNSVVGKSCRNYSKKLYLLNQRAGKIVANHSDCLNYIFYLLQSKSIKENIATRAYGAANQANVSPFDILGIKCEFPSIKAMKVIGDYLSKYDLLIQTNNKRIRILEQMAENLYKEWFVRFRFPGHEKTEFENGLPIGWGIKKLGDWGISLESGGRPKGGIDDSLNNGVPSLGAEAIKGLAEYDYSSTKFVPVEFYMQMKRGKNSGNDILLYKDGAYIGKVTLFRDGFPYDKYSINEHVFFIAPNDVRYKNYLYYTLHQDAFFSLMQNLNRNAAQPGLSRPDIEKIKIAVPSEDVIIEFNKEVEPMLSCVFKLAKQNQFLARQRDLLLPRLMSGKLEVNV